MNKGIYPVLSGGIAQEKRLDILTHNLANLHTTGFKKDTPVFTVETPGPAGEAASWSATSDFVQRGDQSFVGIERSFTDYSPGTIHQSGNSLDFAVEGNGFFVLDTPEGPRYSRNGSFTLDANRQLTTSEGYPVMGENGPILLTGDGQITVDGEGGISVDGSEVNRFRIVDFERPYSLKKDSNSLFSGEGEVPATGHRVLQGALEFSNVSGLKEMTSMIEVMRAYESYQKMMQSLDELSQKANDVGRVG